MGSGRLKKQFLLGTIAVRRSNGSGEARGVGHDRVPHRGKGGDAPLTSFGVAGAAGILHHDRYEAQIGAVMDSRIDSDFRCDSDDGEGDQAAVSEDCRKRRAFKCGESDLIKYRLVVARREFGNDLESWRAARRNQGRT